MFKKKSNLVVLIALGLAVIACSSGDSDKDAEVQHTGVEPLKRSFVLKEGLKSDIICLSVHKGDVYAAGQADKNCAIFKLDSKLKTIEQTAKFGSARGRDKIKDMAMDSDGNVFVVGYTDNEDFPVTKGCYDGSKSSGGSYAGEEGFVAKFSPDLELLASTFFGGDGHERVYSIAIDEDDCIYIAGYSEGADQKYRKVYTPQEGAYDRIPPPENQAKVFVAKLSNDLTTLMADTLLGGNKQQYDSDDEAYDLAIDRDGHVWVAGQSNSVDFPVTKGCVGPTYSGKGDIFVSKLNADLSRLLASTYLGGMNQEMATALVLDKKGDIFVGGWTESPDLPMVPGCYDTKYSHEEEDAFIVKLSSDLKQLKAATYLGGDYDASGYGDDLLSAMDLSANGKMLCVAGRTESENFPVTSGCYKNYTNDNDTAFGDYNHRNHRKPRESSTTDKDYGDGFITLFNSDLTKCQYSTYLGGDNLEYVDDIIFDDDELLVAGITYSYDFPRQTSKEKSKAGARGFAIRFDWEKNR